MSTQDAININININMWPWENIFHVNSETMLKSWQQNYTQFAFWCESFKWTVHAFIWIPNYLLILRATYYERYNTTEHGNLVWTNQLLLSTVTKIHTSIRKVWCMENKARSKLKKGHGGLKEACNGKYIWRKLLLAVSIQDM